MDVIERVSAVESSAVIFNLQLVVNQLLLFLLQDGRVLVEATGNRAIKC